MDNNRSGNVPQSKESKNDSAKKPNLNNEESKTRETKFKEDQRKLKCLVQKHLEEKTLSSSDEEEELPTNYLLGSVIQQYFQKGGKLKDLERTRNCLENIFHSGANACLICLGTVKRNDQIWSCSSCFGFFHLLCIQGWAKGSIAHQKLAAEERPNVKSNNIFWECPKCRKDYEQTSIPNGYVCFCGQKHNPEFQPWSVPHSCGEVCNKSLSPSCPHNCLLLCHPGPCPPCPQTLLLVCFCLRGGKKIVRCSEHCGQSQWSGPRKIDEASPGYCPLHGRF